MENRIKVVLVDKKRTNKWLSEQLGCAPTTVSKWCTNACQPPMETFVKIAELLEVDINEMITKDEIQELLHSTETYRVERTTSTGDMDKFQEAIFAFANDLSGSHIKGYLIQRAYDDGGNVGGKNGGDNVPSLSPALSQVLSPVLSQVGRRTS